MDVPWLQPYPDRLLDAAAAARDEPEAVVTAKEMIELAFLATIQRLPARQRAVLILRDTLDWSVKDTAAALNLSQAAVNSALQRARATLAADHRCRDGGTATGRRRQPRARLSAHRRRPIGSPAPACNHCRDGPPAPRQATVISVSR